MLLLRATRATKMADTEDPGVPPELHPCSICSRTFVLESLEKHYKSCEKNANQKRKIFDSTKQRVQGTELAEYLPVLIKTRKVDKSPPLKAQSKWKEHHLEFVRAIRAARGINDGEQETSMTALTRPSNTEQCPTCERNFGPKAYDRHIEWCREQQARLPSKSNTSTEAMIAKERLEARTKYRAPPLNKSKREITREKYSVSRSGGGDTSSKKTPEQKISVPNASNSKNQGVPQSSPSEPKESASASSFQRTPHRSSYRQGSASPVKKASVVMPIVGGVRKESISFRSRDVSPQKVRRDVKEAAPKLGKKNPEFTQKLRRDKLVSETSNLTEDHHPRRTANAAPTQQAKSLRTSDAVEKNDLYLSAKRQLLELLSHDDSPLSETKTSSLTSSPLVPRILETSPTSAFSKYSSSPTETITKDSTDFNETYLDDLMISGQSAKLLPSSKSSSISDNLENYNNIRDIAASLSSLSICSLEDINLQNGNLLNVGGVRGKRRNLKYRAKLENAALSLRQSVSMFHPGDPVDAADSNFFEELNRCSENEDDFPSAVYPNSVFSLSSIGSKNSLRPPDLYADDEFDEEQLKAVNKRTEDFKRFRNKTHSEDRDLSSPENNANNRRANMFNADSAYSSLNRKSPLLSVHGNINQSENCIDLSSGPLDRLRLSSSGSESSLPALGSNQVSQNEMSSPICKPNFSSVDVVNQPQRQSVQKMSKFCHECGSKFPLTVAKFCCECGAKRLTI